MSTTAAPLSRETLAVDAWFVAARTTLRQKLCAPFPALRVPPARDLDPHHVACDSAALVRFLDDPSSRVRVFAASQFQIRGDAAERRDALRRIFAEALTDSNVDTRLVAAWGLISAPDFSSLALLDRALALPRTQDAALFALWRLHSFRSHKQLIDPSLENFHLGNLQDVFRETVAGPLKHAAFALRAWSAAPLPAAEVLAYLMAVVYAADNGPLFDGVLTVISSLDPHALDVSGFLFAAASDPKVALPVRRDLVRALERYHPAFVESFRALLDHPERDPDLVQILIELEVSWIEDALSLEKLLRLVQRGDLPLQVRGKAYRVLWSRWSAPLTLRLFDALLQVPDVEDVRWLLDGCLDPHYYDPSFRGMESEAVAAVIAFLESGIQKTIRLDEEKRCLQTVFLGKIPYDQLPRRERERVLSVAGALAAAAAELPDSRDARNVLRHELRHLARHSCRFQREWLRASTVPLSAKCLLLQEANVVPARQDLRAFLRAAGDAPTRVQIFDALVAHYASSPENDQLIAVVRERLQTTTEGDSTWRVICDTPELWDRSLAGLIRVLANPQAGNLAHRLAVACLRGRSRLFWTHPRLSDEAAPVFCTLYRDRETSEELAEDLHPMLPHPQVLDLAMDPRVPLPRRIRLIDEERSFAPPRPDFARRVLDLTISDVDPALRLAALNFLLAHHCLGGDDLVAEAKSLDQIAKSGDATTAAALLQDLTEKLRRLAGILRGAPAEQLAIVGDAREPVFTRATTLFWLTHLLPYNDEISPAIRKFLWSLYQREADPEMSRRVADTLKLFYHSLLRYPDFFSPPMRSAIASLWKFPDTTVVHELLAGPLASVLQRATPEAWSAALRFFPESAPAIPDQVWLPIAHLAGVSALSTRLIDRFRNAYRLLHRQHTAASELSRALLETLRLSAEDTQLARQLLERAEIRSTDGANGLADARELSALVREITQLREKTQVLGALVAEIPPSGGVTALRARIHEQSLQIMVGQLPGVDPDALERVLRTTPAPLALAHHYRDVHQPGLPLLAAAINAASSEASWLGWRYERTAAEDQVAEFSAEHVALWRQNLTVPVTGKEAIPTEVQLAAVKIRSIASDALRAGKLPDDVSALLASHTPGAVPRRAIARKFPRILDALGRVAAGRSVTLADLDWRGLPADVVRALFAAVRDADAGQARLLHERFSRADEVLQLLFCDERSLARNTLRADFETRSRGTALATAQRLVYNFRHRGRRGGEALPSPFADDLEQVATLLRNLSLARSSESYLLREHDDFRTLIEIGHVPYAQGSCQDYASDHPMNRGLLGYVVDATTKALLLYPAANPRSPVARAIVRFGAPSDRGTPVLVLERTYAFSRERGRYDGYIQAGAVELANARNWRIGVPDPQGDCPVTIAASQNGCQYEDGAAAIVGKPSNGMVEGPYTMRVRLLPGDSDAAR